MGAEGESRSVICESLRQKDSVKDTKKKSGMSQLFFVAFFMNSTAVILFASLFSHIISNCASAVFINADLLLCRYQ